MLFAALRTTIRVSRVDLPCPLLKCLSSSPPPRGVGRQIDAFLFKGVVLAGAGAVSLGARAASLVTHGLLSALLMSTGYNPVVFHSTRIFRAVNASLRAL